MSLPAAHCTKSEEAMPRRGAQSSATLHLSGPWKNRSSCTKSYLDPACRCCTPRYVWRAGFTLRASHVRCMSSKGAGGLHRARAAFEPTVNQPVTRRCTWAYDSTLLWPCGGIAHQDTVGKSQAVLLAVVCPELSAFALYTLVVLDRATPLQAPGHMLLFGSSTQGCKHDTCLPLRQAVWCG